MATTFSKGQQVKLKAVLPQGEVKSFRMDEDGVVYCLISWTDADGKTQTRWFQESDLTAVE